MKPVAGNLFILAAPSGGGKSSLIKALLEKHPNANMQLSVSLTTRAPRPGEIDGKHYHFVSKQEFEQEIANGTLFEWAEVFGNYYGTSRTVIEQTLQQGVDIFLDIDWQGARQVKQQLPDTCGIFILPPSEETLRQRLVGRGQDSEEVINQRMAQAKAEISHYSEFDYLVINDDFDHALGQIEQIIEVQRLRLAPQRQRYADVLATLLPDDRR